MPKSKTRRRPPADVIASARRPQREVTICLRADIAGEIEALEAELEQLGQARAADARLGGVTPEERGLANRIQALEEEADENSIDLLIRALPRSEWRAAKAKHPASDADSALGWAIDRDDTAMEVLHPSVVQPALEPDALTAMAEDLAEGQWRKIVDAILTVNGGDGSVPFSQRASLIRQLSSSEEGSPEPTASPSSGSTDGNPAPSRRSPAGKRDTRLGG